VREDSQGRKGRGSCHEATFVERRMDLIGGWANLSRIGHDGVSANLYSIMI